MPQEIKQLIGAMNLDDPIESIGRGFHRDARNIVFRGTPPNRRVELVPGNAVKNNAFLPGSGTNKTILERYDPKNKCIYFFNFNSAGSHGIYRFNTIPETFQRLVEVGVNTNGDVLGFTAEKLFNFDIIYGDSSQGDIIYWIDSLGRTSKLNVSRALTGGYGTFERTFLDVCKEPADIPPVCIYEKDAANTVNNLRKKLFKFKIRWVFDDQDKAVTSSQGEMPLPFNIFDQAVDTDPTQNCRIAIVFQTGPANVKKIELLAAVSTGNVFSDFFLITSLDKVVEGLSDNDLGTYLFYNDKGYNYIDINESDQLFDYLPHGESGAGAQTTLNGNTLAYGNVQEGYPNLTNFSFNGNTSGMTAEQDPYYYGETFSRLVATQSGKSGFGSGNIHIVVRGLVLTTLTSDAYTVYMTDGSNISYTVSSGDDAAAVIEGLRVDALGKGYSIISNGANDLIVSKTGISLARSFINSNYLYNTTSNSSFYSYDWLGKHGWGLVYFDQKGESNGVVYTNGFSVSASPYTEGTPPSDKPTFNASLYHVPPDWAYYYQWVRTKDLKKSKFQQWVSDRTYKDLTAISGQVRYAYISIQSLNTFVVANPGSPLGYGFSAGDRITFFKRYNADGSTNFLYYNTKDFEIVASVIDPTVNGEVKVGQFVKIILPSTDGSFDFGDGFFNYFIEMYTPAQSVANGLDLYYEYGERYAIGNPTLSTRFHQGMLQNQTADHLTPATFEFTKGDFYIKTRAVQTGNEYLYTVPAGTITGANGILVGINFISQTYPDSNITTQSQPYVGMPAFNPATDGRWFIRAITATTFRVRGSIILNFTSDQAGSNWSVYLQNRFSEKTYLVPTSDFSAAGTYTFTFDTHITLEDDRLFLFALGSQVRTISFLSTNITFTIDKVFTQRMVDQNFSDYFPSAVNSNGRAWIYDPNANRIKFPTMIRWGLAYQEDTNVNKSNRFYPENFDNVDRRYGAIAAMGNRERSLVVFQERKCGSTGVYQKNISDSAGNNQLITTDKIITSNNINYYDGDYGVYNQPTSIVKSGYVYYLVDPIKSKILRESKDGLTDLTELYKVQTWAGQNLPRYLNPGQYQYGGEQKVLGVFNVRPDNVDEYLLLAQGTAIVPGEIMAFEESYNSFYGKIDADCDGVVCAETALFFFKNGILWKQTTSASYCFFFGIAHTPTIDIVYNENVAVKKIFMATGYMSNAVWVSDTKGDVETNLINSQTGLSQQSLIMSQDYDTLESPKMYASFNFDMNSRANQILGLWEGDYLAGEIVTCKLKGSSGTNKYLYAPFITYRIDNRNP
jgi:hypothetical protein